MTTVAHDPIVAEFHDLVNMSATELEHWLRTDESNEVGWSNSGTGESVGHHSGRHIVTILHKHRDAYTAADIAHMHKVVAFIKRHSAQGGPAHDPEHSRWRYSLKNWGRDPLKARRRR
jgi:hypothetical protein